MSDRSGIPVAALLAFMTLALPETGLGQATPHGQEATRGHVATSQTDSESATRTAAEARLRTLSRILMRQSRSLAILEVQGGEILVHGGKLPADGPDLAALEQLMPGEVQTTTAAAVTKLRSDVELRFGEQSIPTGNLAEGFAGVYGLWLKRGAEGWRLVFNNEADVWGTQRDPGSDVAEIRLDHETLDEKADELTVALTAAEGGGVLEIRWGSHRWSAPFRTAAPAA